MGGPWWREAVTYQVYIRSFADGNGDGTGDIAGLRTRLGHLVDLGVDAVWINPWYVSPLHDGGYDVADYRNIDPRYGSVAEAKTLIAEAHALGLRVLGDLVPNHTSVEHEWFRTERHDHYHVRPGRGSDGAEPPTNWQAVFGGPAWERLPGGDWYLHLFDVSQPDLNWANPAVRDDFLDILAFWFDLGIDGFRVDVAHALTKDPEFPDLPEGALAFGEGGATHPYWDRDEVHDIIRTWRHLADTYDGDRVLVAEAWVAPDRLPLYLEADQYHQSFNFEFLGAPWKAVERRDVIERSLELLDGHGVMPTWVLANHDVPRQVTRFGRDGLRRARAAALLMLALPGSVYLYQGEELGLPEVTDLPEDVLDDPIWERSGRTLKGRDGCRVPIPWTRSGPSFGFGDVEPWLPQPERFAELSVEAQAGQPGSTLELYRAALRIRSERLVGTDDFEWLDLGPDVIAFRRGDLVSITNFGGSIPMPDATMLLRSVHDAPDTVGTDETVWLERLA